MSDLKAGDTVISSLGFICNLVALGNVFDNGTRTPVAVLRLPDGTITRYRGVAVGYLEKGAA